MSSALSPEFLAYSATLQLDSAQIGKGGNWPRWRTEAELRYLIQQAREQEARRFEAAYSHVPWYAEQARKDPDYWQRRAQSYYPPELRPSEGST